MESRFPRNHWCVFHALPYPILCSMLTDTQFLEDTGPPLDTGDRPLVEPEVPTDIDSDDCASVPIRWKWSVSDSPPDPQ